MKKRKELKVKHLTILSPVVYGRKGEYYQLLYDFLNKGFKEARIDKKIYSLHDKISLPRYQAHTIEIVIDKPPVDDSARIFESIESALNYSEGLINVIYPAKPPMEILYSSRWSCPDDGFSFEEIEPRLFSFNSPYGACSFCHGLGKENLYSEKICPQCQGKRLKPESLAVKIKNKNCWEIISLTIEEAYEFFVDLESKFSEKKKPSPLMLLKK